MQYHNTVLDHLVNFLGGDAYTQRELTSCTQGNFRTLYQMHGVNALASALSKNSSNAGCHLTAAPTVHVHT